MTDFNDSPWNPRLHFASDSLLDVMDGPSIGPALERGSTASIANAPAKAIKLYHQHREEKLAEGASDEEAHRHGLRMLHHAGWFKAPKAWKQITPDLRDKVNVREAIKQPDGTYAIYDVDVFYPNAVKHRVRMMVGGIPMDTEDVEVHTADDIRQYIQNTNASIDAGAPKPMLTEGHPSPEHNARGMQLDSYGSAVNWRESPRGNGWARCDLINIDPEIVHERLKRKRLPGLSAGLAQDGRGLNKRFGHVAMLGGQSQALSHLPTVDVYHAAEGVSDAVYATSNQLCFASDPMWFSDEAQPQGQNNDGLLSRKVNRIMNMPSKEAALKMADASAAHAAACRAFANDEPNASSKMSEAMGKMRQHGDLYASTFGGEDGAHAAMGMPGAGMDAGMTPSPTMPAAQAAQMDPDGPVAPAVAAPGGAFAIDKETGGSDTTLIPEPVELTGSTTGKPRDMFSVEGKQYDFDADPAGAFAADPAQAFGILSRRNAESTKALQQTQAQAQHFAAQNRLLIGRQVQTEFLNYATALRRNGHEFSDDFANDLFSMAVSNKDPKTAIKKARELLAKQPKKQRLSDIGPGGAVFGADSGNPPAARIGRMTQAEKEREAATLGEQTNLDFSAEMIDLGEAMSGL